MKFVITSVLILTGSFSLAAAGPKKLSCTAFMSTGDGQPGDMVTKSADIKVGETTLDSTIPELDLKYYASFSEGIIYVDLDVDKDEKKFSEGFIPKSVASGKKSVSTSVHFQNETATVQCDIK